MGFKLLVVDDEPIVRRGIRQLVDLKELGITECREASDGLEAKEMLNEYKPDIVLADINMPHMDGLSFVWELKKVLPSARIILITGYDYFEYAREAIRLRVDDYILKPVSRIEIQEILNKSINKILELRKNDNLQKVVSELAGNQDGSIGENDEYMTKIVQIMEDNYQDQDFDLTSLAIKINLSQGYLSRIFKNSLHKTFPEYLNEIRLDRARILILGTNMKMYEITEKCGYSDPNYFSLSFKKKYGSSPNKYREKSIK